MGGSLVFKALSYFGSGVILPSAAAKTQADGMRC